MNAKPDDEVIDRPSATFDKLVGVLERGGAGGNGAGNGGDGGGGDRGDGDDGDRFRKLALEMARQMLDAFEQMGKTHSDLLLEASREMLARASDQVMQVADLVRKVADQAVRGDELVMKTLGAAVAKSVDRNADLAEHLANFAQRLAALEGVVAQLKAGAGQ